MSDVVNIAISQLGVTESSGNNDGVPFDRYALKGEQPLAWCARFVRWCFAQAGHPLPGNAYVIASVKNLHGELASRGAILPVGEKPRRGDLILIRNGDSDVGVRGNHIGIVERFDGKRVHSVDGNLGNKVARVARPIGDPKIWCFARWPVEASA
jgi:cell wall-associated NlpC family hydrolase